MSPSAVVFNKSARGCLCPAGSVKKGGLIYQPCPSGLSFNETVMADGWLAMQTQAQRSGMMTSEMWPEHLPRRHDQSTAHAPQRNTGRGRKTPKPPDERRMYGEQRKINCSGNNDCKPRWVEEEKGFIKKDGDGQTGTMARLFRARRAC